MFPGLVAYIIFVSFSCKQDDFARFGVCHCVFDRLFAVGDADVFILRHAGGDIVDDGVGLLATRIVACHNHEVGKLFRCSSHLGTLTVVPLTARSEEHG